MSDSKLIKLECSPRKLWTLFFGLAPVLEAMASLDKVEDRLFISNGLDEAAMVISFFQEKMKKIFAFSQFRAPILF